MYNSRPTSAPHHTHRLSVSLLLTPLALLGTFAIAATAQSISPLGTSCTNLCLKQVSCPGGGTTSLSGTVYTPNGVDPLPNAVVYVPNASVAPFTPGVACVTSAQPVSGSPLVGTTSSSGAGGTAIGSYTLSNMPVGTNIPVVIQAGRWRRQYTVNTTACTNTTLNMSFPSNQTQGDIPLIAVASGNVDAAECVLRKVGINDSEFTVPTTFGGTGRIQLYQGQSSPGIDHDVNGVTLPLENVLVGTTTGTSSLNNYDMIMFPCQGTATGQATNASWANLQSYANAGGRIFATHWSEVWLSNANAFAGTVNWTSDATLTAGTSPTPNATILTSGFASGTTLASWLQNIGATSTYGQLFVDSPHQDLASVIAPTQSWLTYSGTQKAHDGNILQFTFNTPVGAASSSQCGRVMYNDYHVETPVGSKSNTGVFPTECDTGAMTSQEKLLEYGLFDLSTFITPPGIPDITASLSNSPTNFTQGDTSDSILVNVNDTDPNSPANPSLTLTVTLPPGLTVTSMTDASGGGWLCTPSTLTCNRVTGLDANSSDNVLITVSVAQNAPVGVVMATAVVSGGGLTNNVNASETFHLYGVALITWPTPAAIPYGTALSSSQLDATANTAGNFIYAPPAGAVLNAGTQTLSTLFTPTDTVDYPNTVTDSVQLTVTAVPQTIIFAPIPSPMTWGSIAPITLSATGGASGNPVVISVLSGPATITGNILTITGAGTVIVQATQAGTTNYAAATPVNQTVLVNQATQTITFAPLASPVTYGVSPMTLSATGGASGNPVTFNVTGPASISGTTLTITGAGTVVVTASQAGTANYSAATPVVQTVIVNPASQTIAFTAPPTPVNYGVLPITLVATATSSLPITFSVISGPAAISGNVLTITGGGTIVVAADQPGNANYTAAAEVIHTILVQKATTTLTLSGTPTTLFTSNPITLTASLPTVVPVNCNGSCALPSGTVTFIADGGDVLGTSPIGANETATLTTSFLYIGQHTITAIYNGDNAYYTANSNNIGETLMDFAITPVNVVAQDVEHGSTVVYTFQITPKGGTTLPQDVAFVLSGYPYGSNVTFSPNTLAMGSSGATVTLTIASAGFPSGGGVPIAGNRHSSQLVLACVGLGALLLPFGRRLRRRSLRLLATGLLLIACAGAVTSISGCGTGWNHENFSLDITADSGTLTHTISTTLSVH